MPLLDFAEIPPADAPSTCLEAFEIFAGEFLEHCGYTVIEWPSRGQDGEKDLIVERMEEVRGEKQSVRYIVSCKHYAHSGTSVRPKDERDIFERIKEHGVGGFIGFYSTELSSGLAKRLKALQNDPGGVEWYTPRRITRIASERYGELHTFLLQYFPESVAEHDKYRYPSLPAGAEHLQFKRDNPEIDIRTQVIDSGVVAMIGLVEGSREIDAPFMGLVLSNEEEAAKFAEAIGVGKFVGIPTSRLSYDQNTTLGRFLHRYSAKTDFILLKALPERKSLRVSIRFQKTGTGLRRVSTIRNREMEMVTNVDGSFHLRTPLPHESDKFYIDSHLVLSDEGVHSVVTINLAVKGETPAAALEIERARVASREGASLVITDLEKQKRITTWDIPPDESKIINPVVAETLERLVQIEDRLGIDFVIPTNEFSLGDCDLIERVENLLRTGRSHFSAKEGVIAVERPDEAARGIIEEGKPTDIVWRMPNGVRFRFMGRTVTLEKVVWIATRWKASIEDMVAEGGKEYSLIRISPTEESEIEAIALDFIEENPFGDALESLMDGMIRVQLSVDSDSDVGEAGSL